MELTTNQVIVGIGMLAFILGVLGGIIISHLTDHLAGRTDVKKTK